ncbi:unnamed protein product, partial [Rotaria sp. Silwood2]
MIRTLSTLNLPPNFDELTQTSTIESSTFGGLTQKSTIELSTFGGLTQTSTIQSSTAVT